MNQHTLPHEEPGRPSRPSDEALASAQHAAGQKFLERLRAYRERQAEAEAEGIPALVRLVHVAQGRSGQCHHVRRFLLGIYNAYEWPFELNRLRGLDEELQEDCLRVLRMDLQPRQEIHLFLNGGDMIFQEFWEVEEEDDADAE